MFQRALLNTVVLISLLNAQQDALTQYKDGEWMLSKR
jgi:hypothetical protein